MSDTEQGDEPGRAGHDPAWIPLVVILELGVIVALAVLIYTALFPKAFWQSREFEKSLAKWNTQHVTHYRYIVHEAPSIRVGIDRMPISIEVRSDGMIKMADKNGTTLTDDEKQMFDEYAPIPNLFDAVEHDIDNAYQASVAYDAKYGFPSSVKVDFFNGGNDDDWYDWITDFQVLP